MFEAITAWATLLIAICTIFSVFLAYRAINTQAESLSKSVSADLALKLAREFSEPANIELRSQVSQALLQHHQIAAAEDLFDFFEQVGLFLRKGLLDPEVAYSFFFHWVNLYWVAGQYLIEKKRSAGAALWSDFEHLYLALLQIERKSDPRSRFINPSDELIKQGLEEELQ